ncbi:MAG: HD-GYP domain-containing protein [Firmicutes bacterium]|nr:HD-GYP domain-containing protein [Bacillota bacterium]
MKKTISHSLGVALYAVRVLGDYPECPQDNMLFMAGLLHDIGKVYIPTAILNKKDKLTEEEFRIIRMHPLMGAEMLNEMNYIYDIVEAVLHHHERWDGKGYPFGLKGQEIPLYSRILSVADAFDAMISDRPYKKAIPRNLALAELKANAGTQFDPYIIESFVGKVQPELSLSTDVCSYKEEVNWAQTTR